MAITILDSFNLKKTEVSAVKIGSCFRHNQKLFMRIENYMNRIQAVCFNDASLYFFVRDDEVIAIDDSLVALRIAHVPTSA